MIASTPTSESHPLAQRLEALALPLVKVSTAGNAQPIGDCPWFERLLIDSPVTAQAIRMQRSASEANAPSCITLGPGVQLVFLDAADHAATHPKADHYATLLVGPEVIESEMLQRICGHAELDLRATVQRIDTKRFVAPAEAERLALTLGWMRDDSHGLATYRSELMGLGEELANNYEELSLLYKLSCNMTLDQSPLQFFGDACTELQEVSGLGWIALQLTDDQPRLQQLRGTVYTAGSKSHSLALRKLGRELLKRYDGQQEPIILDDTSEFGALADCIGADLLVVPLVRDGRTLGVLFGGDRENGEHIDSFNAKLCASLCNSLTIFIENLMLFEDAQSLFLGTLHALTSAIDAKDSYTFGHSERVAMLSQMLARAAGLDEELVERIYIAGLVHDVGKIGVPEAVLCKPGRLTEQEFDLIKMHPGIGATILRDIRQMDDLIPGVLYHHERWDGHGYPEKKAGLDIPLFGRVIGLADAFDAMSSDRTYRSALKLDQVLAEVRRCKGKQFDPELAEVFLGIDFEPYFQMIQRHRAANSRGIGEPVLGMQK